MALPDTSAVVDALNAAEVEQAPAAAPEQQAPVEQPSGDEAPKAPDGQPTPVPPDGEPQPSDPVASYSALIKDKGAKAAFDLLPDDVKEQIAAEMYPGVHRAMSKKEAARVVAEQKLEQVQNTITKVVNDRFDELMTQGLTDEDKKSYFDRKRIAELDEAEKAKATAKPSPEDIAAMEEAQTKMEYAWSLIEKAGLPRDPNDPRVRSLDFAWDEADFGKAMQRLTASIKKTPSSPNGKATTGVATPAAAPSPDLETVKKMAAEMAAEQVRAELRRLNILKPDNGRPGAASGTKPPRSMQDAVAEARSIIERELPGR